MTTLTPVPISRQANDLSEKTFGRYVVLFPSSKSKNGSINWACKCACGAVKEVAGYALSHGRVVSCGCYHRELSTKHGKSGSREYILWLGAKKRAELLSLPFDIEISDVVIPTHCPCLGIEITAGEEGGIYNSPSIDRIVPSRGYVKDNIWVISYKANRIKNDATPDELLAVANAVAQKAQPSNT